MNRITSAREDNSSGDDGANIDWLLQYALGMVFHVNMKETFDHILVNATWPRRKVSDRLAVLRPHTQLWVVCSNPARGGVIGTYWVAVRDEDKPAMASKTHNREASGPSCHQGGR